MEIYLDNAATTKPTLRVIEAVVNAMDKDYGNPSGAHMKAIEAENLLRTARKNIADSIGSLEDEIYFTSGGTESNNIAIQGIARGYVRSGKHIITTAIEHPSVLNTINALDDIGYEITYLPVDSMGFVKVEAVIDAIREDTIMVSVMYVNNEVGSIQPIIEIAKALHEKSPEVIFHVDAVQGYGKLPIDVGFNNIHIMTASAHKLHGPKGVGILYVKKRTKLITSIHGGGQERGIRSGTQNVPGVAGMNVAVVEAMSSMENNILYINKLRSRLADGISHIDDVKINSKLDASGVPHILNVSFEGIASEVLLHALEDRNIYVSAGSSCSSRSKSKSYTLSEMNRTKEEVGGAIRFSLSKFNTIDEIEEVISVVKELVPMLRRYRAR